MFYSNDYNWLSTMLSIELDSCIIYCVFTFLSNLSFLFREAAPCPDRLLDDLGGAFGMGLTGGAVWHGFSGFFNAPKGQGLSGAADAIRRRAPLLGGQFAIWGGLFAAWECGLISGRNSFRDTYLFFSFFKKCRLFSTTSNSAKSMGFVRSVYESDAAAAIFAGGLTSATLAVRSGPAAMAFNFAVGAFMLAMIEGLAFSFGGHARGVELPQQEALGKTAFALDAKEIKRKNLEERTQFLKKNKKFGVRNQSFDAVATDDLILTERVKFL